MSYHSTVRACSVTLSKCWDQGDIRALRANQGALMSTMTVFILMMSVF